MRIELKSVKFFPDLSEETDAFSAVMYVDGVKAAEVRNRGNGGGHEYYWFRRELQEPVQAFADKQECQFQFEKLDQLVERLLDAHHLLQWLKRNTSRKTLFRLRGDKLGEWRIVKAKYTAEVADFLRRKYPNLECVANVNLQAAIPFCVKAEEPA